MNQVFVIATAFSLYGYFVTGTMKSFVSKPCGYQKFQVHNWCQTLIQDTFQHRGIIIIIIYVYYSYTMGHK